MILTLAAALFLQVKFHKKKVTDYHNMLDVFVSLSNSESFGVSVLEASACAKPVVVSDASGYLEVVLDKITGLIVPRKNPEAAADAIGKIITDKVYAKKLGENGRKHVEKLYDWNKNLDEIIMLYKQI
ncbi:MAG: glycosyltransferase family 4 protein [Bacteroidota bacterium]